MSTDDPTGFRHVAIVARVPGTLRDTDAAIVVDLDGRTVISGTDWRYQHERVWTCQDLEVVGLDDPDGWGSLAAGIVLERELLSGRIDHAVALEAPDHELYGRTVRLPYGVSHIPGAGACVAQALHQYGGLIVGTTDGLHLAVRCEQSQNASGDHVGATYKAVGIGGDLWPTRIPIDLIEVIA